MAKSAYAENSLGETKSVYEFEFDQKCKTSIKCKANVKNMAKPSYTENFLARPVHKFELD